MCCEKEEKQTHTKKINTFHCAATSPPNKSRLYLFIKLCNPSLVGSMFNEWQLFDIIDSNQDSHLADKLINQCSSKLSTKGMFVRILLE